MFSIIASTQTAEKKSSIVCPHSGIKTTLVYQAQPIVYATQPQPAGAQPVYAAAPPAIIAAPPQAAGAVQPLPIQQAVAAGAPIVTRQ